MSLLSKLSRLVIQDNNLTGGIPTFLGNITSMEVFTARRNPFGGSIPDTLGVWKSLTVFYSGDCNLYGRIPHSIFNLSLLVNFSLAENHLSGSLPSEIGSQLPNLELLQLRNNELTGVLPPSLSNCTKLGLLEMALPGLGEVDDMKFIDSLKNCSIYLSGSIPSEIKDLKMLSYLYLSYNNLSGTITSSLGKIPQFLDKWNSLEFLNLSFNDFEGKVPVTRVFANASAFSVLGNNRLCGGSVTLELPKCKENGSRVDTRKGWCVVVFQSCGSGDGPMKTSIRASKSSEGRSMQSF
ncbi:kinase-like domain-containing protein [Tanacetum coccineum]